jgi:hypothetical protein
MSNQQASSSSSSNSHPTDDSVPRAVEVTDGRRLTREEIQGMTRQQWRDYFEPILETTRRQFADEMELARQRNPNDSGLTRRLAQVTADAEASFDQLAVRLRTAHHFYRPFDINPMSLMVLVQVYIDACSRRVTDAGFGEERVPSQYWPFLPNVMHYVALELQDPEASVAWMDDPSAESDVPKRERDDNRPLYCLDVSGPGETIDNPIVLDPEDDEDETSSEVVATPYSFLVPPRARGTLRPSEIDLDRHPLDIQFVADVTRVRPNIHFPSRVEIPHGKSCRLFPRMVLI